MAPPPRIPPPHATPFQAGMPSSSPPWAPTWIQPSWLSLLWSAAPHFYPVSFFTGRDVKATDTPPLRPLPVALSSRRLRKRNGSRVAFQHFRIDPFISPTLHKGRLRHREVRLPKVTGLGNGPSTKFKTGQSGFRSCASQIGTGLIGDSSSAPSHLSANPLAKRARSINSCFIELSPSRFLAAKAKTVCWEANNQETLLPSSGGEEKSLHPWLRPAHCVLLFAQPARRQAKRIFFHLYFRGTHQDWLSTLFK